MLRLYLVSLVVYLHCSLAVSPLSTVCGTTTPSRYKQDIPSKEVLITSGFQILVVYQ